MFIRTLTLIIALTAPAFSQGIFGPPKAKVVATPAPAPAPKKKRPAAPKPPADPLAAYMPSVKGAFSLRWVEAVTPKLAEFTTGKCSITFKLDVEGKVLEVAVASNTSNEAFAKFCEQFVRDAVFEKPPEKALIDGQVEIPFTFTIL